MKVRKPFFKIILSVSLMMSFATGFVSAQSEVAPNATYTQASLDQVEKNFADKGIDQKTQAKLIEKLKKGQLLDSVNPKMKGTAKIVKKETMKLPTGDEITTYQKMVFPDGSVAESGIDMSEATMATTDIDTSLAIITSGTGYTSVKGAKVYYDDGLWNYYFYADYTFVQGQYNDYISRSYNAKVTVYGGSASDITLVPLYNNETAGNWAQHYLTFNFTAYGGGGSENYYLYLHVHGNTAEAQSF